MQAHRRNIFSNNHSGIFVSEYIYKYVFSLRLAGPAQLLASIRVLLDPVVCCRESLPVAWYASEIASCNDWTWYRGFSSVWPGKVKRISSTIAHPSVVRTTWWNAHPSRSPEGRFAAIFCIAVAVKGLSPWVISLAEVVMYCAHHTGPMTADPISAPSRRASWLRLDAHVGIGESTGSQCSRGCRCYLVGRAITGCGACTPSKKPCITAFCPNFVVGADVQVGTCLLHFLVTTCYAHSHAVGPACDTWTHAQGLGTGAAGSGAEKPCETVFCPN